MEPDPDVATQATCMTCDRVIHLHTHMNNWDMVELALRVHHKQHHPPTDDDDDE